MEKTAYEYLQLAQRHKDAARRDLEQAEKFERLARRAELVEQIAKEEE